MPRRLSRTIERAVVKEARSLNKDIMLEYVQYFNSVRLETYIQEMSRRVIDSVLESIILGYSFGKKRLKKDLQLSLSSRINREMDEAELNVLKMQFEYEAEQWSLPIRKDMADLMRGWARIAQQEGYTAEQAGDSLGAVLKARGYGASSARNISNVMTTGLHMGYNGVIYIETIHNPDVWGYRYRTAGDEKVRDNHIAQVGVTLPKEDMFWTTWWPPNGYNCRCTVDVLTEQENIVEPEKGVFPDSGFATNPFIYHSSLTY